MAMKKTSLPAELTQWMIIDQLFQEAVDERPAARAALLSRRCGDDDAVLNEVQRLLELHDRAGTFLENPNEFIPAALIASLETRSRDLCQVKPARPPDSTSASDVVGRFRLLRLLDSGGMGDVWLAERADGQFQQTVAIKVFRAANAYSEGVERFLQERQTLARLEHPSIARLIDGGTTADGTPYLVMEWVDGIPIVEYCEENELSRKQRIELFQLVCDAVHFAHQSLIIHRDLKPANILVSPSGRPKLLDFGIAQWMQGPQDMPTAGSPLHRRTLCTPDFASPEQIGGGSCTTASDVFSLGVILRRMCYGGFRNRHTGPITKLAGYSALVNADTPTVDTEQTLTADAVSDNNEQGLLLESSMDFAHSPVGSTPADDLVWIIRKAMQRDPAMRYTTARELSTDLGRMLLGYPVDARPPSAAYRTVRFVQRNVVLSAAGLLLAVVLSSATIATSLAWQRASAERDAAQAATRFIGGILSSTSPFATHGGSGESINGEVLATTSRHASSQLQKLPGVEIQVRAMLAQAYASLWQWPQVRDEANHALKLVSTTRDADPTVEARCLTLLGRAQTWLGEDGAVTKQQRALALREKLYGRDHTEVAETLINLGFALWKTGTIDQRGDADRRYREGLETFRRTGISCSADYARALLSYSAFRDERSEDKDESYKCVWEAVECYKQLPDAPDRYRVAAQLSLASHLLARGEPAKALAELKSLAHLIPIELDAEEPTRRMYWTKGRLEVLRGDQVSAFHSFRRALRGECLAHIAPGPHTRQLRVVAQMFRAAERVEDLLVALHDLVPILGDSSIPWDPDARVNAAMAASLAFETSRSDEARGIAEALLDAQNRQVPRDAFNIALLRSILAEADFQKGDHETALRVWKQSFDSLNKFILPNNLLFQPTIQGIVKANEALGKHKAANQYRALLWRWE